MTLLFNLKITQNANAPYRGFFTNVPFSKRLRNGAKRAKYFVSLKEK